jgi:hypothetical protein
LKYLTINLTIDHIPAPNVAAVQAAIEYIYPLVYEFRNERIQEDEVTLTARKRKSRKRKLDEYKEDDLLYESTISEDEEENDVSWN